MESRPLNDRIATLTLSTNPDKQGCWHLFVQDRTHPVPIDAVIGERAELQQLVHKLMRAHPGRYTWSAPRA